MQPHRVARKHESSAKGISMLDTVLLRRSFVALSLLACA
ncbi:MAG: hypothetical protein ACI89X_004968, partial [Planctomycetota bacterium]